MPTVTSSAELVQPLVGALAPHLVQVGAAWLIGGYACMHPLEPQEGRQWPLVQEGGHKLWSQQGGSPGEGSNSAAVIQIS